MMPPVQRATSVSFQPFGRVAARLECFIMYEFEAVLRSRTVCGFSPRTFHFPRCHPTQKSQARSRMVGNDPAI